MPSEKKGRMKEEFLNDRRFLLFPKMGKEKMDLIRELLHAVGRIRTSDRLQLVLKTFEASPFLVQPLLEIFLEGPNAFYFFKGLKRLGEFSLVDQFMKGAQLRHRRREGAI